jgi:hypothetical protein
MTKKKGKSVEEHLPKRAPKKTGSRGIGPKPDPQEVVGDLVAQDEARASKEKGEVIEIKGEQKPAEEKGSSLLADKDAKAKKGPKQGRLPTMEDPAIEELEDSAENYADVRDQRMELTREESRLKEELLGLMKKHKKTSYVHGGFDIKVIVESEKLRVRIKKED